MPCISLVGIFVYCNAYEGGRIDSVENCNWVALCSLVRHVPVNWDLISNFFNFLLSVVSSLIYWCFTQPLPLSDW